MRIMGKNLEQTRYMISAASSYPPVLELLSRYGYGKERLQQGLALYEAAHAAMQAQRSATYVKIRGTTAFQEQWKEAKLHYQVDLSRARYVLRNNEEARNLLMLEGKRPAAFEAWYEQAMNFYTGLRDHPEWQTKATGMGFAMERVDQGIQRLQALEELRTQRDAKNDGKVDSKRQRDAALVSLNDWMSIFRAVARLALVDQPHYQVYLGLIKRVKPKPKKKRAVSVRPSSKRGTQARSAALA